MSAPSPRVTVGIPTRNRAEQLARAIESILGQTYGGLELIVSDNASTDATADICRDYAARDVRVRCVRHAEDVGLTGNFNSLLGAGRGDYVMLLADDDWVQPDYVQHCLALLERAPDHVVVSGGARYHRDGAIVSHGAEVDVLDDDPARRVRRWFAAVQDDVSIYGLIRWRALESVLPMRNCLAGDWLLIGRLAMAGKIATEPQTWINRSAAGTSESYARTVSSMGLSAFEARHPHLAIARFVYEDIARDAPAYAPLGQRGRRALAATSALAVLRSRPFNVVEDALRPYLGRPRLRRLDDAVRPIVRRLQR